MAAIAAAAAAAASPDSAPVAAAPLGDRLSEQFFPSESVECWTWKWWPHPRHPESLWWESETLETVSGQCSTQGPGLR